MRKIKCPECGATEGRMINFDTSTCRNYPDWVWVCYMCGGQVKLTKSPPYDVAKGADVID